MRKKKNINKLVERLNQIAVFSEFQDKEELNCLINNISDKDMSDFIINVIFLANFNGLIDDISLIKSLKEVINFQLFDNYKQLMERATWLQKMKLMDVSIHLEKSHKEVLDTFDRLNVLLNTVNIEYYHTSGVLTYLLIDKPLVRYHHDIDVFLNENDLDKLIVFCQNSPFEFREYLGDKPGDSKRRTIKLYDKQNNIIISVFLFERLRDGSVVINDYYFDVNGNLKMDQDYNSPRCVELSFSDKVNYHNNIPYKSITLEALYNCKKGRSIKHQYDCSVIEEYVNLDLEAQIDSEKTEARHYDCVDNPKIIDDMYRMLKNEKTTGQTFKITKK